MAVASVHAAAPHYEIGITLDPATRSLSVSGTIGVPAGQTLQLRLGGQFRIERFDVDGRAAAPVRTTTGPGASLSWEVRAPETRPATITLSYAGTLAALDAALDHRQVLALSQPVAASEGAYLPAGSLWYPEPGAGSITYRVALSLPAGYRGLTSARLVEESLTAAGNRAVFEARDPAPGIDLIAGPYAVAERTLRLEGGREVAIRTYFHHELEPLAAAYLESAARYIARYDRSIGPYAFSSYSIVSSALPTGFGMPGIAYLGRQVLRLPFIRATSLGHEVLHDWWGNGVYADSAHGNWSEGLTTFLADHALREDEGSAPARAMRLGWLRDFAALRPEQDRPLALFTSRRHGADQAIGYNKAAFVFFMLRDLIGPDDFNAGLRRFWAQYRHRVAAWDDLQRVFAAVAQRDLGAFFAQWVQSPGAPALSIAAARRSGGHTNESVAVDLRQLGQPYRLRVPLRFHLDDGTTFDASVDIDSPSRRIVVPVPRRAVAVAIDPDARLFRRLERQEVAPILRQAMLDPRTRVAVAGSDAATRKAALAVAGATLEHAVRVFDAAETDAPLLIIGLHDAMAQFLQRLGLPALPAPLSETKAAYAYAGEAGDGRHFAVVSAPDAAALEALARPLPHLGAQSYVVFDAARSVERGVWPREARRYPITN